MMTSIIVAIPLRASDRLLINTLIVLIVLGVVLWLILKFIPMDQPWPQLIKVASIIAVALWLLNRFGFL
jgi:hypothetical protein